MSGLRRATSRADAGSVAGCQDRRHAAAATSKITRPGEAHIGDDCGQRECGRRRGPVEADLNALKTMPFHRGADLPGIGMQKFDLAANGGAGVGFEKRAIGGNLAQRSEEHRYERQSLIRNAYAVYWFK